MTDLDVLAERLEAMREKWLMATPDKTETPWAIVTQTIDGLHAAALERDAMRDENKALAVLLDNVVIAQSLSKELRQAAHDQARAYLYTRRQALNQEQPA